MKYKPKESGKSSLINTEILINENAERRVFFKNMKKISEPSTSLVKKKKMKLSKHN